MFQIRTAIAGVLMVSWALGAVQASGFGYLSDEFDNFLTVGAIQDQDAVKKFREKLDTFQEKLRSKNQRDIERLLGKPTEMARKTYAMPVAQARSVILPGTVLGSSKGHREFYPIKDVGGLEIWYEDESPIMVVVRLKVDKSFPRAPDLLPKNLAARLAWDREKFDKLVKFVEGREKEVKKEKK